MNKFRYTVAYVLALLVALFGVAPAFASMTSSNYQILWDTVGVGGDSTSSSSSYKLRDVLGENAADMSTSTNYTLAGGFRGGTYDKTVDFRVLGMGRSYQVGATSVASTTVTVTTTSGYAAGSFIVLIQDEGSAQVSAMGKLTTVTATTLTVDAWTTNGTSPAIDGSDDVVYLMTTAPDIELGTLNTSDISTFVLGWQAAADVSQGYSVYLMADHGLQSTVSASTVITAVSDGAVTVGVTEYGARSSDTSLALSTFDTADTAITTSLQQVASRGDNAIRSRDFLTLKAAIATGTTSAEYTQALTLIFVGDY